MTIEIIGIDESVKKEITCRNCATKLRYTPSDVVTLWSGTDYGGGPDGAEGFKCPKCNRDIIINRW